MPPVDKTTPKLPLTHYPVAHGANTEFASYFQEEPMSRISRTLQLALVVISAFVLLFGIAARLILAFTPLWLDVATIVAVPFALLVLYFVGRRPRN